MEDNILKQWLYVKYFTIQEFDSPDAVNSGKNMDINFVLLLDKIRKECGFPFRISSGFRTKGHNEKVGGKPNSAHTVGFAVDVSINNSSDRFKLLEVSLINGIKRIGIDKNFVHLDYSLSREHPQSVCWLY